MNENQEMRMSIAECPMCGETIALRPGMAVLHRIVRCTECCTHLRVSADRPVDLQVFRSHGLAFRGGQVRGVWSTVTRSASDIE